MEKIHCMGEEIDARMKLDLLVEGIPFIKIGNLIEDVILREKIGPGDIAPPLSADLRTAGGRRLQLIMKAWDGNGIGAEEFKLISRKERIEILRYLLMTGWVDEAWIFELLRMDSEIFDSLLSYHDTREAVVKIIHGIITSDRNFRDIAGLIVKEAISEGKAFDILTAKMDKALLIENYLKRGSLSDAEMTALSTWAKKRKLQKGEFPYMKSYFYPRQGISDEVLQDTRGREKFLAILIRHHQYNDKDLEKTGFSIDEIRNVRESLSSSGLLGKVKKWFGSKSMV